MVKALRYLEKAIFAHTHIVYAYDPEFYDDFYDLMGKIIAKIYFDNTQEESDILPIVKRCVDEFSRILLLKMNPISFTSYQYPFDK